MLNTYNDQQAAEAQARGASLLQQYWSEQPTPTRKQRVTMGTGQTTAQKITKL